MQETAFDDQSHAVPFQEFDYGAVDGEDLSDVTNEDLDRAAIALTKLLEWVFQSGSKNVDGLKIRTIIVCWIFLKSLRSYSLTKIASGFGLHKQSIGRWHDDFKVRFPMIRTPHMIYESQVKKPKP